MLNILRNSISGWTAKILIGLLVVSFAVWGIGDVFRGSAPTTVVRAGETEIGLQEYALAYQRATAQFRQQLGRRLSAEESQLFGIDQTVISQLVAGALLQEQGRILGLGLSEDQLAQTIAEEPAFQDASGNFSRANLNAVLQQLGLSQAAFIESQEEAAKQRQLVEALSAGTGLPEAYERALGLFNGERRTIDYVNLGPDSIPAIEEPNDEELQAYFAENQARYRVPELRSFSYAALTPEALANPGAITEEEIAADYQARQANYATPERRQVRQILFETREEAEAAAERLASGVPFDEIASEAGPRVTDFGLVARNEIPDDNAAEAAFSREGEGTTGIVDGLFGPLILSVEAVEPGSQQPLEAVAEEIRQELALAQAGGRISDAYNLFEDARAGGATFREAAQQAGLEAQTVEDVDAAGERPDGTSAADLPVEDELLRGVFENEPGFDAMPIPDGANGYVFYVTEGVTAARDATLEEVRDRVVSDWQAEQQAGALASAAEEMRSAVAEGQSLQALAAERGLEVRTAQAITRQSGSSELGSEGTQAAFSGPVGTVAQATGPSDNSRVVLVVREISPPADPTQNVSDREREQLAASLENDLLDIYLSALQGTYSVQVSQEAIQLAQETIR